MKMDSSFARICLITPCHLSTNPRLVKEADALADAGYDVVVIAADFQSWSREADRSFSARPWKLETIIRFGPQAPWRMRLIQAVTQRLAKVLVRMGVNWPPLLCAAWHPAGPALVAAASAVSADLYIAHYPAALAAAAASARQHGTAYAFDAEDFHPGDRPDLPRFDAERALLDQIERLYLPGCAYVTAASPGIADAYARTYGIDRPTVLLNTFPRIQSPATATPKGVATTEGSIYWFSQTIGPDRGLETALRAIATAKTAPHLYLRGVPARGFDTLLLGLASDLGVNNRVHLLPPAPPEQMERLAAQYDLGLATETGHTENRKIALANKIFSYILAGVPIIASDIPAHVELAPEFGDLMRLVPVDDATALANVLDEVFGAPEQLARYRAAAFRLGQDKFNWDLEAPTLVSCVEAAVRLVRTPAFATKAGARIA